MEFSRIDFWIDLCRNMIHIQGQIILRLGHLFLFGKHSTSESFFEYIIQAERQIGFAGIEWLMENYISKFPLPKRAYCKPGQNQIYKGNK